MAGLAEVEIGHDAPPVQALPLIGKDASRSLMHRAFSTGAAGRPRAMSARGLTLVEVVVTLLLLGVLTAIALPSWQQHQIRLRRADARSELLSIAGRLSACFARLSAYDNPACTAALSAVTAGNTYRVTGEMPQQLPLAGHAAGCADRRPGLRRLQPGPARPARGQRYPASRPVLAGRRSRPVRAVTGRRQSPGG